MSAFGHNLRTWTPADWAQLDGVDEVLAQRIHAHLASHDLPETIEELGAQLESVLQIGDVRRGQIVAALKRLAGAEAVAHLGKAADVLRGSEPLAAGMIEIVAEEVGKDDA
jgi:hypothetical protein